MFGNFVMKTTLCALLLLGGVIASVRAAGPTPTLTRGVGNSVPAVTRAKQAPSARVQEVPAPVIANLWVDMDGGSCTRLATAAEYVSAQACSSFEAAVAASANGDTIRVKAGSYPAQTVTTSKGAPGVRLLAENGTSLSSFSAQSSWVSFENFTTASLGKLFGGTVTNMSLVGVNCACILYIEGGTNNLLKDMTLGPGQLCGELGVIGLAGWASPQQIHNMTIDGVTFTGWTTCAGQHSQAIWPGQGVNGLTIKNSTFLSSNDFTTAYIFYGSQPVSSTSADNIVIENNFFGSLPTGFYAVYGNQASASGICPHVTFRYNTALATLWPGPGDGCSDTSRMTLIGNVGSVAACGSATYMDNVWVNPPCSGSDLQSPSSSWNLVGDGFHLGPGSSARGNGASSSCPATDHDGEVRPQPTATTCDAGADEAPDPTCQAGQLRASAGRPRVGVRTSLITITLRNVGPPCQLQGYAGLSLRTASRVLPTRVRRGGLPALNGSPLAIGLARGPKAVILVAYSNVPARNEKRCSTATRLGVRPPGQPDWLYVRTTIKACNHGMLRESPVLPAP
jgi:hypothetical protein